MLFFGNPKIHKEKISLSPIVSALNIWHGQIFNKNFTTVLWPNWDLYQIFVLFCADKSLNLGSKLFTCQLRCCLSIYHGAYWRGFTSVCSNITKRHHRTFYILSDDHVLPVEFGIWWMNRQSFHWKYI